MRAYVEEDKCISCGLCTGICPEVFEFNAAGKAEAVADTTDANAAAVDNAIDSCPVRAIRGEE